MERISLKLKFLHLDHHLHTITYNHECFLFFFSPTPGDFCIVCCTTDWSVLFLLVLCYFLMDQVETSVRMYGETLGRLSATFIHSLLSCWEGSERRQTPFSGYSRDVRKSCNSQQLITAQQAETPSLQNPQAENLI